MKPSKRDSNRKVLPHQTAHMSHMQPQNIHVLRAKEIWSQPATWMMF